MTYVPVSADARKGHGRTPLDIPPALLAKLQHSRSTGDRLVLELTPEDDSDEVADLKRAIVRAGYRHFPDHTIYKRFSAEALEFWVGPKKGKGGKR